MRPSPVLDVRSLTVGYRRNATVEPIFENLTFTVNEGRRAAIIGDSGAGKSTLLNVIAGFLRKQPSVVSRTSLTRWIKARGSDVCISGNIMINGDNVSSWPPRHRNVGLVMQKYNLYPHLSVWQNLAFPLAVRGKWSGQADDDLHEIARKLRISEYLDRSPSELSGGQQQRVAIGKLLLRSPALALLDEPFSSLDQQLRDVLRKEVINDFLGGANPVRRAMVMVTHDLEDAIGASPIILLKRSEHEVANRKPARWSHFEDIPGGQTAWDQLEISGKIVMSSALEPKGSAD